MLSYNTIITHANVYFYSSLTTNNKTVYFIVLYFIVSLKLNQGFQFVLFIFVLFIRSGDHR